MAPQPNPKPDGAILALDVGNRRIGIAVADPIARIARPLTTVIHDDQILAVLQRLVAQEGAAEVVVGLPRNLEGNDTPQTAVAREFATKLEASLQLPVTLQDEALTSVKAEEELAARGVRYDKGDIDALAATYILEDYLQSEETK